MSGTLEQRMAQLPLERRALLQKLLREKASARAAPQGIRRRAAGEVALLSYAQQRLWFIDQMEPGTPTYNMVNTLRLRGALDPAALRRAFTELVRRHEVLRTTLHGCDGEPVQRVHPAAPLPLPLADLRRLGPEGVDAEARRLAMEEALLPFDLARGPLLRVRLFRLGEEEHVLSLTMHHIVSDGWSMGVLAREVSALYGAYSGGGEPELPELPVQYADYALWQREWLSGEAREQQLAYWRDQLAGAPPVLDLPNDHPPSAGHSERARACAVVLPDPVGQALRALALREEATLHMTFLAAWQVLLGRYAGEEDVVVGTPVAGRSRVELEGLIGLFANVLAIRTSLAGNPSFAELVGRVREVTLGGYVHQAVPFERLVEELRVERSRVHAPLFQVTMAFEQGGGAGGAGLSLSGVTAGGFGVGSANNPFRLALTVSEQGERIRASLAYQLALFEPATAERMLAHFGTVLGAVATDPGRGLSELSLLAPAERERVVVEWNRTAATYPHLCIHDLFAGQAARTPDAVAVVFEGVPTLYGELDARSSRLAHHLRRRGVGAEVRVGVCMERSTDLVVALLGVLRAGGAYVPVDPSYPAERIAHVLADSGVPVVLTHEPLLERLPRGAAEVVCLDRDRARIEGESGRTPSTDVSPENLAYVIYTSGSTGAPKGAMNEHRGVVNRLLWMQEEYGLTAGDAVLQKTPFSFDVSVWEFFWPLLAGARLVVARPEGHRDPAYLAELIRREEVTTLHFVPPMLQAFLEGAGAGRCRSVRRVVCSGEALPPELVERFFQVLPHAELHNLYGPTEAAVDVTYRACGPDLRRSVPIGRPVANTQVYVLDSALNPVPVRVAGELYVGGVQVGRGYLARPGLTAERFVPDPFGAAGGRLYRTGDRARWTDEGEVEYLGRTDFQVKVRGFRIEPGEVEAALRGHAGVREAVVTVREDSPGDRRLVGYLVTEGGLDVAALRARLGAVLPEHMVPGALVVLEALPLTPNGKLDRRALPAPEWGTAKRGLPAPRDAVELGLARIWEELLGVGPVGVRDDFFGLGGHSLLAVRMMARVEQWTGSRLPVATLFEGATIEHLAAALRRHGGRGSNSPLVPIQPRGSRRPLFFVHPAGGNVLCYAALARHLGTDQPFFGLQSRGLAAGEGAAASVQDMAADYLALIRSVQPRGPYRLGGWSMGGVVALEMARQVEGRGEAVETLALVDPPVPGGRDPDEWELLRDFALHLDLPLERMDGMEGEAAALDPEARLGYLLDAAREAGVVPPDLSPASIRRLYGVYRANVLAARAYRPAGYAGALTLFLASAPGDPSPPAAGSRGWERLAAGGVEVALVPGGHFDVVREPHVRALAEALAARLPG